MKKISVIFFACFSILSCASSSTTMVRIVTAQTENTNKKYHSILIRLPNLPYISQVKYEDLIANLIVNTCNVSVYKSYELFPPTENFNEKETKKVLAKYKIDAILTEQNISSSVSTQNTAFPITTPVFGTSRGTVNGSYNGHAFSASTQSFNTSYQTTYIPYTTTTITGVEEAFLTDVKKNKRVWYASLQVSGNNSESINEEVTNKVVSEMYFSGLVGGFECYTNFINLR